MLPKQRSLSAAGEYGNRTLRLPGFALGKMRYLALEKLRPPSHLALIEEVNIHG